MNDLRAGVMKEAECFEIAWQEWFDTKHEFGIRDKEFLRKGLDQILNFILIYVRKNDRTADQLANRDLLRIL